MAKKRLRDFKRIAFTAKTGELIRECLVDKTFNDHFVNKQCETTPENPCSHESSGNLAVARLVEPNIKIGKKRATLDIPDPYCTDDCHETIKLLLKAAVRLRSFASKQKRQQKTSFERLADEIQAFAERCPLTVLADIAAEAD